MLACNAGQLLLCLAALLTALGKAGGEDNETADAFLGAGTSGLEDSRTRNGKDSAVNVRRQVRNRTKARAAVDDWTLWIHEVEIAGKPGLFEIREHSAAERSGSRRCAQQSDRTRPQQAIHAAGLVSVVFRSDQVFSCDPKSRGGAYPITPGWERAHYYASRCGVQQVRPC